MILHEIHDLSNFYVVKLLSVNLAQITDANIIKNYHPDYSDQPGNLFKILKDGRYRHGQGKYFVIEEDNKYICSAGWNEYTSDIALLLTRMYVSPEWRTSHTLSYNVFPIILNETINYKKQWMSVNEYNKSLYDWFVRYKNKKLFGNWPITYKKFYPIGIQLIYNTPQYVVELDKTINI